MKWILFVSVVFAAFSARAQNPDPVQMHPISQAISFGVRVFPMDFQRALRRPYRDELYAVTAQVQGQGRTVDLKMHVIPAPQRIQDLEYKCGFNTPTNFGCQATALSAVRSFQSGPRTIRPEDFERASKAAMTLYLRQIAPLNTIVGLRLWQIQNTVQVVINTMAGGRASTVNMMCHWHDASSFDCHRQIAPGPGGI